MPHYCLLLLPVYNIWLSQDVLKCQDICALMHTHLCMYASHLYMLYVHIVTRVQVCMHACMHISGYICACHICTGTDLYAQILRTDMYAHNGVLYTRSHISNPGSCCSATFVYEIPRFD